MPTLSAHNVIYCTCFSVFQILHLAWKRQSGAGHGGRVPAVALCEDQSGCNRLRCDRYSAVGFLERGSQRDLRSEICSSGGVSYVAGSHSYPPRLWGHLPRG